MKNNLLAAVLEKEELGIGGFVYALEPQDKFLDVNRSFPQLLGYSNPIQFKAIKLSELFVDQDQAEVFFELLKKKKKVKSFEAEFKKKSEKAIWVAITALCCTKKNSKQRLIEGIIQDITFQKNRQIQTNTEKDFLQSLLDNIPDAVYFKDCKNRLTKVNKFYIQGTGLSLDKIIGKTDFDFFPHEQAKQMFDDDNYVLTTGKSIIGKIERTRLHDGRWNQVITTKIPMSDKNGEIIGTMGITRDMTPYANLEQERFTMLINALTVLTKAHKMRDPYTFEHTQNVANIAGRIGKELNWDQNRILGIRLAGELHDVGKISIPLDILNKPGKLSELEYQLIQEHVANSCLLIKDIDFPFDLSGMIYQHHERLDGSGYPKALKDKEIILEARILAISDVLESMTSHRPYRPALSMDTTLEELNRGSNIKYDRDIVEVVKNIIENNDKKAFW